MARQAVMIPEHPTRSKAIIWLIGIAAGAAILLLAYSIRALAILCVEPPPPRAASPTAVPALEPRRSGVQDAVDAGGASSVRPGNQEEAVKLIAPTYAPATQSGASDSFSKDYELLRQREAGREETIKIIRRISAENPESGYAMDEEQLREFEKSGAALQ